jgi:MFS family permease
LPTLPLILLMVLTHLTYTGARFTLQLYAIKLTATPFTVGLLMSLLAIVPAIMSVHIGRWTDRVGPVKPAIIAIVSVFFGTLIPVVFQSLSSLYAASLIIGSGFMVAHIAVNNAVGHTTPENRTRAFSHLALGFSTSSMMGPVVAGFAIEGLGHVAAFAVLAASTLCAFFAWLIVRKRVPSIADAPKPPANARVMDLLRIAELRAVFIVSGMLSMAWDMFNFMVPLHGSRIHLSPSTLGLIMGCFGVATFVVRAGMPFIAARYTEWQTLTGALVTTAGVYFLFPLFEEVAILMSLAFILGLGLGSAQPMVMTLLHAGSPPGRAGEAVGVRTTFLNTSSTVVPLTVGSLGAVIGVVPAFWIVAVTVSACGVFAFRHIGEKRVSRQGVHGKSQGDGK